MRPRHDLLLQHPIRVLAYSAGSAIAVRSADGLIITKCNKSACAPPREANIALPTQAAAATYHTRAGLNRAFLQFGQ